MCRAGGRAAGGPSHRRSWSYAAGRRGGAGPASPAPPTRSHCPGQAPSHPGFLSRGDWRRPTGFRGAGTGCPTNMYTGLTFFGFLSRVFQKFEKSYNTIHANIFWQKRTRNTIQFWLFFNLSYKKNPTKNSTFSRSLIKISYNFIQNCREKREGISFEWNKIRFSLIPTWEVKPLSCDEMEESRMGWTRWFPTPPPPCTIIAVQNRLCGLKCRRYSHRTLDMGAVLRIQIPDPVSFWPWHPGWVKSQDPDPGWTTWLIFPRA
jgi:hypothetical protein